MDDTVDTPTNASSLSQAAQTTGSHRRTYQACIPCRKRKVRCDLGPVDDPHDPPCQRCRRESKECYFSATRRKRRWSGEEEDLAEGSADATAAYNVRRKSARGTASLTDPPHPTTSEHASPLDGFAFGEVPQQQNTPQYIAQNAPGRSEDGQDRDVANETAATLLQSPINSPGDALHLLLQASGQSEDVYYSKPPGQAHLSHREGNVTQRNSNGPSQMTKQSGSSRNYPPRTFPSAIDPAITSHSSKFSTSAINVETLNIWSRLRFVRAGWFTAREAVAYIEYYYQYLAPMTPVCPPDFRNLHENPRLLSEEPMLAVTLLTIASRYLRLPGPGGQTRSHMIHERLWTSLQNMINRMFWGHELYTSGAPVATLQREGQHSAEKGALRSLGTIESLLLLSDFHPRSIHFPPSGEEEDIIVPASDSLKGPPSAANEGSETPNGGGSTLSGWTEPALRSDRMTWSLIGLSSALASEAGVFGTYTDGQIKRQGASSNHPSRAERIERLLYIYITQACGRFGFPSQYSDQLNKFNLSIVEHGQDHGDSNRAVPQSADDQIQGYWVEMAAINKACNDSLFPSKDQTASYIHSGEYINKLAQLQPMIEKWHEKITAAEIPKYPKVALLIDLHYFRLYINGLALQAVLEQWTTKVGEDRQAESPETPNSTLSSHFASLYSRSERYVKEVIDASRTILRYVVFELLPNDYLKHAPVRLYFRIVSAAMFLLKTFALGGRLSEVKTSLRLMEDTIKALRTSVVDDVHLCLRISDLLESLTSSIGNKFVRLPPQLTASPQNSQRNTQTQNNFPPSFSPFSQDGPSPSFGGYDQTYNFGNTMGGIPHTHTDPNDSSIAIMPPPAGSYNNFNFAPNTENPMQPLLHSLEQLSPTSVQNPKQQPMPYHSLDGASPSAGGNARAAFPFPSEEDWLTLDLQPLIDATPGLGDGGNGDGGEWYGAFGPETQNNLEVLGKLVNEQWTPNEFGF